MIHVPKARRHWLNQPYERSFCSLPTVEKDPDLLSTGVIRKPTQELQVFSIDIVCTYKSYQRLQYILAAAAQKSQKPDLVNCVSHLPIKEISKLCPIDVARMRSSVKAPEALACMTHMTVPMNANCGTLRRKTLPVMPEQRQTFRDYVTSTEISSAKRSARKF